MRTVAGALCIIALALAVPMRSQEAAHHACLEQERAALERGEGFGMALVADRNGYPGPRHILDLKDELQLSSAQTEKVQALFERMRASALAAVARLFEKEAELERLFAAGGVSNEAARRKVEEVAAARAELRWVHLSAHLEAFALLSPEQRARYQHLRHGGSEHAH